MKIKKGTKTKKTIDDLILENGKLPKLLEVDLEDYLTLAEFATLREDGLYYKGMRMVVN